MFLFASPEVELLLNALIAAEVMVVIYLWYQKGIWPFAQQEMEAQEFSIQVPLKTEDEREAVEDIVESKLKEIEELNAIKENAAEVIKQAKRKYMKGEIGVDSYRAVVNEAEKEIIEADARLNLLQEFGSQNRRRV
ncbi:MAG: hypothetical protein ACP5O3_03415 [Candidatus Micrarchaeia archaeon]|jgi:U3 small nucleolar ribonucleoprotein component